MMDGVDPCAYMQIVGGRMDRTDDLQGLNRMLDGLEYLYEVLDPELQDLAESLMQCLREKMESPRAG